MAKFCTFYTNRPPVAEKYIDEDTVLIDQSEADMCSLQAQLDRYGINGLMAKFEEMKGKFGYADTRLIPSFSDLQNRIVEGQNYFNELPSEIRAKYDHDAGKFFDSIEQDPKQALDEGYISSDKAKELLTNVKQTVDLNKVNKVETVEEVKNESAI